MVQPIGNGYYVPQVVRTTSLRTRLNKSKYLLIMIFPGMLFYIVFSYMPLYGIQLAFKDYTFNKGIWGSAWVGFDYFRSMFILKAFWTAVRNTLVISLGRLLFEFPIPIIVALLLNELRLKKLRRFYQTVFTFPHFVSWVVVFGLFFYLFSSDGSVNKGLAALGLKGVGFLSEPRPFLVMIFASDSWKEMGWGTIIYLAAIAGINPEIYEAATVDGANRVQRIWHIILPSILSTITILFILAVGNAMNAGFEQIFNMYSAPVYSVADIIDTFIYRQSFTGSGSFSLSTAAGLFKSIINFGLIFAADRACRALGQQGLY